MIQAIEIISRVAKGVKTVQESQTIDSDILE